MTTSVTTWEGHTRVVDVWLVIPPKRRRMRSDGRMGRKGGLGETEAERQQTHTR